MTDRRDDATTTEGSGVIDLHALVALHERAHAPLPARDDGDELPLVPLTAPPAATARPALRPVPTLLAGTAFHVLLALTTVALAATLAARPPMGGSDPTPAPAVRVVPVPATTTVEPIIAPPEVEPAPEPEVAPALASVVAPTPAIRPRASRAAPAAPRRELVAPDRPATAPSAAAIDPSIDALLEAALSGPRATTPAPIALPATPSQREVGATLRALEREVAMCREDVSGTVSTRITVAGATGRVVRVDVGGDAAGGGVASCVAGVVETARFPQFANEQLVVAFPYRM